MSKTNVAQHSVAMSAQAYSLLSYLNDNPIESLYDPVDDECEEVFQLKKYLVLKMEVDAINDGENVVEI